MMKLIDAKVNFFLQFDSSFIFSFVYFKIYLAVILKIGNFRMLKKNKTMMKIIYSLEAKLAKSGMLAIYVNCSQYGKSLLLDTNTRVFPDDWDPLSHVIKNSPSSASINMHLRKSIYELEEYEFSFDGEINLHKLKRMWELRTISVDFYTIIEKELPNRKVRESTLKAHKLTFTYLKDYRAKCAITDLDEDFVKGFYEYMKNRTWHGDRRLKESSINKSMEIFRCYYNIAWRLYGKRVPKGAFRWYKYRPSDNVYKALSSEDIRTLENYAAQSGCIVVYQFLFLCYTGMRFSDMLSLTKENVSIENGKMWVSYTSVKTNVPVRLPISSLWGGRAEQIMYRYYDKLNIFFAMGDNSTWNRKISRHSRLCGLNKHLTAHMARHTMGCTLINRNVPITTIQKVLGHRRLSTTMGYAKINDNTLSNQLSFG